MGDPGGSGGSSREFLGGRRGSSWEFWVFGGGSVGFRNGSRFYRHPKNNNISMVV